VLLFLLLLLMKTLSYGTSCSGPRDRERKIKTNKINPKRWWSWCFFASFLFTLHTLHHWLFFFFLLFWQSHWMNWGNTSGKKWAVGGKTPRGNRAWVTKHNWTEGLLISKTKQCMYQWIKILTFLFFGQLFFARVWLQRNDKIMSQTAKIGIFYWSSYDNCGHFTPYTTFSELSRISCIEQCQHQNR